MKTRPKTRRPAKKAAPKPALSRLASTKGARKKPSAGKAATGAQLAATRVENLAKVFHALGARNPQLWAKQHVDTGSDELGRFVLLRALWLRSVEPGRLLGRAQRDEQVAGSLDRLIRSVSLADLDAVVRFAQREALADICRVLDDPADADEGIRWGLFRIDAEGVPLWPLENLRKSLDDAEP